MVRCTTPASMNVWLYAKMNDKTYRPRASSKVRCNEVKLTPVCPSRFVSPSNKMSVACPRIRGPRTTSPTLTTARNITNITRYFSPAIKRIKRFAVAEKFSDFSTGIPTVLIRAVRSSEPGMCWAGFFSSLVSFSVLMPRPH